MPALVAQSVCRQVVGVLFVEVGLRGLAFAQQPRRLGLGLVPLLERRLLSRFVISRYEVPLKAGLVLPPKSDVDILCDSHAFYVALTEVVLGGRVSFFGRLFEPPCPCRLVFVDAISEEVD